MAPVPFVSSGTSLVAALRKAMWCPFAEIEAFELGPFPWTPVESVLTKVVIPVWRS